MITQNIHVRMDAYGIPPVIHAVEGDTWRYLNIYTDDAAINTSNTAVVAIHRPDDSYYTIEAMPEPLFYHLEMDQALTRPGKVECQLKVSSGDLVISTYTFYVIVEPSTTGLPVEQLGYDIYDLIDAAQQIQNVGLTEEIKQALLDCFEHVAWTDEHGQDYVDALEAALYPPAELVAISAVYTQSGTVYTTDTLDSLKTNLVVTAHYTDSTTETVTTYTLSGTLTEGTSVITVTYEGKTTTFNVTVTAPATLSSITAVYTQSGTVYDTDSLDSLKSDLDVTAVYSDSTTQTVENTDYTLSGTLTEGTSTITVSYGGKTTTFTVTVTHSAVPSGYLGLDYLTVTGAEYISTGLAETDYFSAEYKIRQTTTKTSPHIFSSQNTYYPLLQSVSGGSHRINSKAKGTETALTFAWETGVDYVIEVDATTGGVSVNDESVGTIIIGGNASASNKYALFAYGGNTGNANYRFEGLFYYMKLMSSGTVVHEFIPVQRISDSVKGVYDTVTNTFFASSGTAFS